MKLEQTSLAEVIAAEEGNEQYRDLCALSHGQAPSLLGNKDLVPTAKDTDPTAEDTELPEKIDILSNTGSEAKSEVCSMYIQGFVILMFVVMNRIKLIIRELRHCILVRDILAVITLVNILC